MDAGITMPRIVKGNIFDTVPAQLPDQIAFGHIDLGTGGKRDELKKLVLHAIKHVYDRMPPGAVCLMMDYYVKGVTIEGYDSNPGVKDACDEFFRDKQEKVFTLPGGEFSHGYFRKL
jgi:O-methyltransferase